MTRNSISSRGKHCKPWDLYLLKTTTKPSRTISSLWKNITMASLLISYTIPLSLYIQIVPTFNTLRINGPGVNFPRLPIFLLQVMDVIRRCDTFKAYYRYTSKNLDFNEEAITFNPLCQYMYVHGIRFMSHLGTQLTRFVLSASSFQWLLIHYSYPFPPHKKS